MPHNLRAEELETLLRQLGPDRDWAGFRYEQLRERLVSVFSYRGCRNPEDLADETMDRVARKLAEEPAMLNGEDPAKLIFGIAWNVARESFRRRRTVALPDDWDAPDLSSASDSDEPHAEQQDCVDHCLAAIPQKHRDLVLRYYAENRRARISTRSMLARGLAISPNALRLKIHRITIGLRTCALRCMEAKRSPSGILGIVQH